MTPNYFLLRRRRKLWRLIRESELRGQAVEEQRLRAKLMLELGVIDRRLNP